jgi:hypothetical protein
MVDWSHAHEQSIVQWECVEKTILHSMVDRRQRERETGRGKRQDSSKDFPQ